jgi:hypothetical protein
MVVNDYEASEEVNALMATLTVSVLAESTAIAPQLSLVSFACADDDNTDYTMLLKMLKSRWKAKGSLLKMAALLTAGPGPDRAMCRGLRALHWEGLDLLLLAGESV